MRLAIGEPLPPPRPAPTQPALGAAGHGHHASRHAHGHVHANEEVGADDDTNLRSVEAHLAGGHDACDLSAAWAGQAPGAAVRAGHPDQPPRPRLRRRAVLQHGLGHRSRRQQAARRDPAGRPAARQFQPALRGQVLVHGMGFSPDHKTLAVVSIGSQLGDLHRHRDQRGQARHLCRPLAARGVLHAGRQGSLGDRARRGLRRRARRRRPSRRRRASRCRTARACRSSRPTANTATSARPSIPRPSSSRSPITRSSAA